MWTIPPEMLPRLSLAPARAEGVGTWARAAADEAAAPASLAEEEAPSRMLPYLPGSRGQKGRLEEEEKKSRGVNQHQLLPPTPPLLHTLFSSGLGRGQHTAFARRAHLEPDVYPPEAKGAALV